MKPIKEKLRRIVKYWCISYQQTRERDRLFMALFAVVMLVYVWWAVLVL
jgi:hypothetical protein